jgi:uncharacterized membrane protein
MRLNLVSVIFLFFFFAFSGWIGETIMESVVRRRFVSKGFFYGPYVPVHGGGAFILYAICGHFRGNPLLVYLIGTLLCTAVEYAAAIFLEKVFHCKSWDYDTYPYASWCNFQGRIALTTSLFFGLIALALVYFYWDFGMFIAALLGERRLFIIAIILMIVFVADLCLSSIRSIGNYKKGIPNKIPGVD